LISQSRGLGDVYKRQSELLELGYCVSIKKSTKFGYEVTEQTS
jgi:hypothetical protein